MPAVKMGSGDGGSMPCGTMAYRALNAVFFKGAVHVAAARDDEGRRVADVGAHQLRAVQHDGGGCGALWSHGSSRQRGPSHDSRACQAGAGEGVCVCGGGAPSLVHHASLLEHAYAANAYWSAHAWEQSSGGAHAVGMGEASSCHAGLCSHGCCLCSGRRRWSRRRRPQARRPRPRQASACKQALGGMGGGQRHTPRQHCQNSASSKMGCVFQGGCGSQKPHGAAPAHSPVADAAQQVGLQEVGCVAAAMAIKHAQVAHAVCHSTGGTVLRVWAACGLEARGENGSVHILQSRVCYAHECNTHMRALRDSGERQIIRTNLHQSPTA